MDPDVRAFADTMIVIGAFIVVMMAVALVANVVLTWTRSKRLGAGPVTPAVDSARFDRLEQAVDAIAIEVERIGEAHRFSTQLLSERLPARASDPRSLSPDAALGAPAPGFRPSITPH